ncbi:MAG: CDGSH iron-sulfur domain-containing protein [Actinobacteria bacterium]|nr:CDGSH iron-sulfur domain-containing protein [Actinomycetota bacterium]
MHEVTIKVRLDGPYKVSGPVKLVDHEGDEIPMPEDDKGRDTIVLCRCGHSATKPFCDQSHKRVGFRS